MAVAVVASADVAVAGALPPTAPSTTSSSTSAGSGNRQHQPQPREHTQRQQHRQQQQHPANPMMEYDANPLTFFCAPCLHSWDVDTQGLKDVYAQYGDCEAQVMTDKYSGRSRGFGFVTFSESRELYMSPVLSCSRALPLLMLPHIWAMRRAMLAGEIVSPSILAHFVSPICTLSSNDPWYTLPLFENATDGPIFALCLKPTPTPLPLLGMLPTAWRSWGAP